MRSDFKNIDEYMVAAPPQTHEILNKLRDIIKKLVPDAEEAISYQIPTFKIKGKNFIHFAGFENHIGIYPGSTDIYDEIPALKKYHHSKGTLKFPLTEDFPYSLVEQFVRLKAKGFGA